MEVHEEAIQTKKMDVHAEVHVEAPFAHSHLAPQPPRMTVDANLQPLESFLADANWSPQFSYAYLKPHAPGAEYVVEPKGHHYHKLQESSTILMKYQLHL
jgi:hypothetical protein